MKRKLTNPCIECGKNSCRAQIEGISCSSMFYEPRPHGEWIPCSERLPEECENVLAWIERDAWFDFHDEPIRVQECAIGWHVEGRWHFDGYAGGTTEGIAWMPLPEPYKRGEEE